MSGIGAIFSKPKMPYIPPPPAPAKPLIAAPAPVRDDAAVQQGAAADRQRQAALAGRGSTMLGTAASYAPQPDAKRTLLGVS